MIRTKRYGGFLVGDRVRVKETAKTSCKGSGRVMGYNGAKIVVESYPMKGMIDEFMPNQLINLTRIEEKQKEIPELPPISEDKERLLPKSEMNEMLKCQNINDFSFEDFGIKALCEMFPQKKYYAVDFLKQWLSSYPTYLGDVYTSTKDY